MAMHRDGFARRDCVSAMVVKVNIKLSTVAGPKAGCKVSFGSIPTQAGGMVFSPNL
jgi:hypothetical protein